LELERTGVVTKRHGAGTYVAEASAAAPLALRERLKALREKVDALLVEAAHLDVECDQVLSLVKERYEAMHVEARR
jgi:DNA-binding transcriptional regulator YhcF (GntR family)